MCISSHQVLIALALADSVANLSIIIATRRPVALLQPYILEVVVLTLILPLTYYNHYRTRTSSSLVLLFWPLYVLTSLVWARTAWMSSGTAFRVVFYLKGSTLLLGLASFFLECLGSTFGPEDIPPKSHHIEGHVESPLLTANLFSIWTFAWMSELMKKGAKTYITEDDLPSLVPQDESVNLGQQLQDSMKKQ